MSADELALSASAVDPDDEDTAAGYEIAITRKLTIYDQWLNPPPCVPEELDYETVVTDASGYISSKEQIENLVAAGHRLHDWRAAMYANEPTPDDIEVNPTARKDFDFQDAHEMMADVSASVRASRDAAGKKAKEAEASKASTEEPQAPSEKPADDAAGGQ